MSERVTLENLREIVKSMIDAFQPYAGSWRSFSDEAEREEVFDRNDARIEVLCKRIPRLEFPGVVPMPGDQYWDVPPLRPRRGYTKLLVLDEPTNGVMKYHFQVDEWLERAKRFVLEIEAEIEFADNSQMSVSDEKLDELHLEHNGDWKTIMAMIGADYSNRTLRKRLQNRLSKYRKHR